MTVQFDKLAESLGLDSETREQITEAWDTKLQEARQEIAAELREEFARKFEHDKTTLIKSMDSFISEKVQAEIAEFAQDKKALAEDRVRYRSAVRKHAEVLEKFLQDRLVAEVRELREDRKRSANNVQVLEQFVLKQLSDEVQQLHEDRQALVEQRVKLASNQRKQITEAKRNFIEKSAATIEESINRIVAGEISQYRKDIERARANDFGQRIFEAFATEYMTSHLNESSEINKLHTQMKALSHKLQESQQQVEKQQQLLESAQTRIRAAQDQVGREKTMNQLMAPLSKRQRAIMEELLENVKTAQLAESFDRYLPAVLNENHTNTHQKQPLKEGVRSERSGDRRATPVQQQADSELELEMNQLRKLAGIGQ